jgi:hypothetical protein
MLRWSMQGALFGIGAWAEKTNGFEDPPLRGQTAGKMPG